jgi:hypothetical protein
MRSWTKIVALVGSLGCVYMLMTFWAIHKHEARIHRVVTFVELGRKITKQIRQTHNIPESIEQLRMTGWLTDSDWRFLTENGVTYSPPRTNSSDETVVVRMPAEGNVCFAVQLDGYMNKERRDDSGSK